MDSETAGGGEHSRVDQRAGGGHAHVAVGVQLVGGLVGVVARHVEREVAPGGHFAAAGDRAPDSNVLVGLDGAAGVRQRGHVHADIGAAEYLAAVIGERCAGLVESQAVAAVEQAARVVDGARGVECQRTAGSHLAVAGVDQVLRIDRHVAVAA
ncbi:hypothetical protein D9M72_522900 [compost metagenome]